MRRMAIVLSLLWATPCWAGLQVITGSNTTLSATTTQYSHLWDGAFANTEGNQSSLMGAAGKMLSLRIILTTAPDNGAGTDSYTFTFRLNSGPTLLACTISELQTSCEKNEIISIAANDLVALECVPSNTPAVSVAQWGFLFSSSTDGQIGYGGNASQTSTATRWMSPHLRATASSVGDADLEMLLPSDGTVIDLNVNLTVAPGAGTSYTFTLRLCNPTCADTLMACSIADTATTCSNSTDVSFLAGDRISIQADPTGATATVRARTGITITPSDPSTFILAMVNGDGLSTSATEYVNMHGNEIWTSTESNVDGISFPMILKAIYVKLSGAPGTLGDAYALTLRKNAAGTGLGCTVLNAATTCNAQSNVVVNLDDELATENDPAVTPTARDAVIAYLATVGAVRLEGATLQGATVQ